MNQQAQPLSAVLIEWYDSVQPVAQWQLVGDATSKASRVTTVALLLRETTDEIVVATSLGWSDGGEPYQVSGETAIARRQIVRMLPISASSGWVLATSRTPQPGGLPSSFQIPASSEASKLSSPQQGLSSYPSPSSFSSRGEFTGSAESGLAVKAQPLSVEKTKRRVQSLRRRLVLSLKAADAPSGSGWITAHVVAISALGHLANALSKDVTK